MSRVSESADGLAREAAIFSRYLIGTAPVPKVSELYAHALQAKPGTPTERDHKLLQFIARHPWSAGFLDAGLSVVNTDSEVRRRIYVTLSILEAMPEYADKFLPKQRSFWYIGALIWMGARGAVRTLIGVVLVKVAA